MGASPEERGLGALVRAQREKRGVSQAELAERIGSTQPAIARLEAGRVRPTIDTLERVARALGLRLVVDFREGASTGQSVTRPEPPVATRRRSRLLSFRGR